MNPGDRFRTGGSQHGSLFQRLINQAGTGPELAAGSVIEPWQILHLLGAGGMSHVYRARRCDGQFDQEVALKLVRGNPALRERLRHERQVIAALHHPHIVGLIDGGETADGDLWFAMALVEGEPIDQYVQKRTPDHRTRLRLFDAVCAAVEYAHGRGLIHRDIKPANILVDAHGHPRLLDFGIALTSAQKGEDDAALTPDYASPEQRLGAAITVASDIYQLGLVLQLLYAGSETLRMPAAARADLAAVIKRATAIHPDDRYAAVAALRSDLHALAAGEVLAADRHHLGKRLGRLLLRHQLLAATLLVALLLLMATLITSAVRLQRERDIALANEARANAVSSFLVDTLSQADPYAELPGGGSVLAAMDRAAQRLDQSLTESPALRRTLRITIGTVYNKIDESKRCLDLFAAPAARTELDGASAAERARFALAESSCHLALDQRIDAMAALDRASAALQSTPDPAADALRAWALADRGQLLALNGHLQQSDEVLHQALDYARRSGSREHEYRSLRFLGGNATTAGALGQAIKWLTEAQSISLREYGANGRGTLTTAGLLAIALSGHGELQKALDTVDGALSAAQSIRQRGGPAAIVIAQLHTNRADVLWRLQRYGDCVTAASAALDLYVTYAEPNSSQGFNPAWRMATCAYQAGETLAAQAHARTALHYARNGVPVGVINALRLGAATELELGSLSEARALLDQAYVEVERTEIANKSVLPALWLVDARWLQRNGQAEQAAAAEKRAIEAIEASGYRPDWLQLELDLTRRVLSGATVTRSRS